MEKGLVADMIASLVPPERAASFQLVTEVLIDYVHGRRRGLRGETIIVPLDMASDASTWTTAQSAMFITLKMMVDSMLHSFDDTVQAVYTVDILPAATEEQRELNVSIVSLTAYCLQ